MYEQEPIQKNKVPGLESVLLLYPKKKKDRKYFTFANYTDKQVSRIDQNHLAD